MTSLALAVAGMVLLLSSCAGSGEPLSAGRTPRASAPVQLWPDRKPPPAPQLPPGRSVDAVPGVPRVPSGDIRKADWLTVVKARVAAGSNLMGEPQFDDDTKQKINACNAEPAQCPVQTPRYQDLTGDGKAELIVGIEAHDTEADDIEYGTFLAVWVFTLNRGVVTQILEKDSNPLSIEIANGELIMRGYLGTPGRGKEIVRSVYAWDPQSKAMALRMIEIEKPDRPHHAPRHTP
ncbi:hypothetical protein [Streptomyces sp.]|uniref:hypothetical protein n=1 Tax=Streptomyces sp. TaxID=1931 RepID=UPI002D774EE9|nr:hypothetical protein [Streptomyces sp.]HET6354837.1 hypothetical protein [Streptomyces sp.]